MFAAHRQSASLPLTFALNANTACRGYRSFFIPSHSCKHGGGVSIYRYSNVRFCALPLPLTFALNANTACRGYRSFLCLRTRASTAVGILLYRYSNVRFCALPLPLTFALNANTAYRGYRSFFMSTHSCKHGGGHLAISL